MLRGLLAKLSGRDQLRGGLRLKSFKDVSTALPAGDLATPEYLILPLRQHQGSAAIPAIQPGRKVAAGTLLAHADGEISANLHAPLAGRVLAIERRPVAGPPGTMEPCIVLECDDHAGCPTMLPPIADWSSAAPERLRQRVADAGVVGLGGGGFPTAVKLALGSSARLDCLIINGVECEPWISCDDMLMRSRPEAVLAGALIMARALGVERVLVAVEDDKPQALEALADALEGLASAGAGIRLVTLDTRYPGGDERQLVMRITGRSVPPGMLPAAVGAVCQNLATAAAVHDAVVNGRPLIDRLVTVTGNGLVQPRNFRVPIGTPVATVLAAAGGYREHAGPLIQGGSMTGRTLPGDHVPITKLSNCILAPGPVPARPRPQPCIRCGACADVCPAGLLPQQLHWATRAGEPEHARSEGLYDCSECGCCDVVCPSHIALVHEFRQMKAVIVQRDAARYRAAEARQHYEARLQRLEGEQAERAARLERRKPPPDQGSGPGGSDSRKAAIDAALRRARTRRAATAQTDGPTD